MGARRELTRAVIACWAAAALVLFAASRTWQVEVEQRPAPLPAISVSRSGGMLVPALPALALVALAAGGALLATRGRGRLAVGALLLGSGAGMAAAALSTSTDVGPAWPAICVGAAAVVMVVGLVTLRRGRVWPGMGTRYERPAIRGSDRAREAGPEMWDKLDHGIDPTKGDRSEVTD